MAISVRNLCQLYFKIAGGMAKAKMAATYCGGDIHMAQMLLQNTKQTGKYMTSYISIWAKCR